MNSVSRPDSMRCQVSSASKRGSISHTGAGPQRAAYHVDDAMDVVQRQHQEDPVVRGPGPGVDQRRDLGPEVRVGDHDALGLAGGSAGVDHHRPTVLGTFGRSALRPPSAEPASRKRAPAACASGSSIGGRGRIGHHDGGSGVRDHVVELGGRVRRGQRDRDAAGSPDAPLHRDVIEAGSESERRPAPRRGRSGRRAARRRPAPRRRRARHR